MLQRGLHSWHICPHNPWGQVLAVPAYQFITFVLTPSVCTTEDSKNYNNNKDDDILSAVCHNCGGCNCAGCRDLFNAAFVSCWTELSEMQQDELIQSIEQALAIQDIPEITQTLLNLAEFMEHCEKVFIVYLFVHYCTLFFLFAAATTTNSFYYHRSRVHMSQNVHMSLGRDFVRPSSARPVMSHYMWSESRVGFVFFVPLSLLIASIHVAIYSPDFELCHGKHARFEGHFLGDMEFSTVVTGARLVCCQAGEEPQPFYYQLLHNSTGKHCHLLHQFSAVGWSRVATDLEIPGKYGSLFICRTCWKMAAHCSWWACTVKATHLVVF